MQVNWTLLINGAVYLRKVEKDIGQGKVVKCTVYIIHGVVIVC